MPSVFSRIINREIPATILAEDDRFIAILDVMPLVMGHALVIPKKETDYIFDLDAEDLAGIHIFSAKVARAIRMAVPCKRIGVAIIGLEVPHAHIHLVPMNTVNDINFTQPKLKPEHDQLKKLGDEIIAAYGSIS